MRVPFAVLLCQTVLEHLRKGDSLTSVTNRNHSLDAMHIFNIVQGETRTQIAENKLFIHDTQSEAEFDRTLFQGLAIRDSHLFSVHVREAPMNVTCLFLLLITSLRPSRSLWNLPQQMPHYS
jgi:hypothetical protein